MARPRKQTYTLDMYLKKNMNGNIDNNADVQRNFVWNNEQINELIVTVLTDDYIPPIILGEEENSKLHIVDGGQRTAALIKYKYGNHKITSSIENPLIPYKKKVKDEKGSITYEDAVFNIKNKTYEKLPEELKEKFDEYQIETVIHEYCNSFIISRYIKRYNNHVSMNTEQKAFTYIDRYASRIRKILNCRFFVECNNYSENDKAKGVVERIVVETMMCMNHFDNWKTQPKPACKYLNEHATEEEFEMFEENLRRLENIVTDDIKSIFNKKDSFVFLALFDKFVKLGIDDKKFAEFLREFQGKLRLVKRNDKELLFDEIDKKAGTKDKQVVSDKLEMLETIMYEYLHINKKDIEEINCVQFVKENVEIDIDDEEIESYIELFNKDLSVEVDNNSKLLEKPNLPSMVAVIIHSAEIGMKTTQLKEWLIDFFDRNNNYIRNQKENYTYMVNDMNKFIEKGKVA